MATMRRDKVKRLVEQGKLLFIHGSRFNHMPGETRNKEAMPVKLHTGDVKDCVDGNFYVYVSDFTSSSGYAHLNPNGTITLKVDGNESYVFQVMQ